MNRQQRRQSAKTAHKKKPTAHNLTKEEIKARIIQNGITVQDLEKNFFNGYNKGFQDAALPMVKSIYAAVCLVMHEMHGFGAKRCKDVLSAVDDKLLTTLVSEESIQEVWDKLHLQLNFNEPFDRIESTDD